MGDALCLPCGAPESRRSSQLISRAFPPLVSALGRDIGCPVGAESIGNSRICAQRSNKRKNRRVIDLSSLPGSRRWRPVPRWRRRMPEPEMDAGAVEDEAEKNLITIPPVEAFVRTFEAAGLWTRAIHSLRLATLVCSRARLHTAVSANSQLSPSVAVPGKYLKDVASVGQTFVSKHRLVQTINPRTF
jgi:hypothetical protein